MLKGTAIKSANKSLTTLRTGAIPLPATYETSYETVSFYYLETSSKPLYEL